VKLLVAENAPDIAAAIAFGARMTWPGCSVAIAEDGQEALRRFTDEPPDLVVLDVTMPPPDGFDVCQRIRAVSQVPILMLTVRDATLDKIRALDLGADDYLTKPFDPLELFARLRALHRRSIGTSPRAAAAFEIAGLTLDFTNHEVRIEGRVVRLTSTEYHLLEELVRHDGTVLPHQVILERVWGSAYVHDVHYLKVYIRRLRQKLGDDAAHPRYIQTDWGVGYRFIALD